MFNRRLADGRIKKLELDLQDAEQKLKAEQYDHSVEVNRLSYKLHDVESERDLLINRVRGLKRQIRDLESQT